MTEVRPAVLLSVAFSTWCAAAPVMAAEGRSDANVVEEIVVTAQKRVERLQDVPVAISAVPTESLAQQNLVQLRDYYSRIPGLAMTGGGTEQRASSLSLRGVTTGGASAATVAITVDDVPFTSSSHLAQSPLPDLDPASLDRIEVLRGPQGTLYGASSLGGLIKYVTAAPDTNEFSARVEVGANAIDKGSDGYSARGSVNVPIVSDKVAVRASAFTRQDPGYIDSIHPFVNAKDINENESKGGRIALFVQPIEALKLNFSAMRQDTDLIGSPSMRICTSCGTGPYLNPEDYNFFFGEFVSNLGPTTRETSFSLYQARGELDLGAVDLTSISAWGRYESTSDLDTTNVFGFLLPRYGATTPGSTTPIINEDLTEKFTQEVRLASKPDQQLEWLIGAFYTKEDIEVKQTISVRQPAGGKIADAYASVSPSTYEEQAIFGSITYHFTDQFDIQFGARYSEDDQETGGFTNIDGPAQAIFGPSSVTTDSGSSGSATTWVVSPRYRFSPDLMAYARIATGYRPGGPNPVLPNVPATFESDEVTNYELGLKGALRDWQLTYEVALFQVDWEDVQLQATDVVAQFAYFTNGNTARSRGLELSGQWRPIPSLTFSANATFTDAELTDDVPQLDGATTLIGFNGDRLPGSAKFVGNVSVQKDWDVGSTSSVYIGADYSYVGERLGDLPNILPDPDNNEAFGYRLHIPAYSLTDLRGGLNYGDWTFNAYVRNVFDKRAVIEATTRGATGVPTGVFAQPRTYGVSVARTF